jgi:hypothetical protein
MSRGKKQKFRVVRTFGETRLQGVIEMENSVEKIELSIGGEGGEEVG